MQKRIVSLIILLVLLLGACAPNNAATNEGSTSEAPTAAESTPVVAAPADQNTQTIIASGPAECRTASMFGNDEEALIDFPDVTESDWVLGNMDAPVTIIEYSDLQCPYCATLEPKLVEYVTNNPDKVRMVFRHFPLTMHENASTAAVMLEAAGQQGLDKFEEFKAELFVDQATWSVLDDTAFIEYGTELAKTLKLDVEQFSEDLLDDDVKNKVSDDFQSGYEGGVSYTPFLMVNGLVYRNAIPELTQEDIDAVVNAFTDLASNEDAEVLESMPRFTFYDAASLQSAVDYYKELVNEYGQEYVDGLPYYIFDDFETTPQYIRLYQTLKDTIIDRQFTSCPDQVIDPAKSYKAVLKTEKGDVTINLNAEVAPVAVNSFVFLAQNGWYDDITFHRVIPDFVAQTGDPSGLGIGNPGYIYDNEISPDFLFDQVGRVGMANSGEGSNGSQFFITFGPQPDLNGSYTVFAQVESGMEVLSQLTARDVSATEAADPGSKLISVEIIEE
ncbi:MAG: peptidylprolyl isomerase [Anaerolineaceae bacterium]|nr:peptidylprolyl isomerase [Anaerolineaceae bacterium]